MSLLLWEYFWIEADWIAAPPAASASAADVATPMFGSKGSSYSPLPDEFWEIRERYIRRFIEPTVRHSRENITAEPTEIENPRLITKATIEHAKLRSLVTERDTLFAKVRLTANREEFQRQSARVLKLSLDILNWQYQYYEQAAIILLLDIF